MAEQAHKLITVILPQGKGMDLLKQLYDRKVLRAAFGTARAPFTIAKKTGGISRTVTYSVEKDVVEVVVDAGQADEVFAFLYDAAGIAHAHGGFMFQGPVSRASEFALPADLPRG
jgi:hypothetical protein